MKALQIKSSLIIALILGVMYSCQKDELIQSDTTLEDVSSLLKVATSDSSADSSCSKDSKGRRHHQITQIAIADILASINEYIVANYAGSVIKVAGKDSLGNFIILLHTADSTRVGLKFDANGNFLKLLKKEGRGQRGSSIDPSSLPSSIQSLISSDYAGATIHRAILESDGSYKVIIAQADGTYLGLSFDANGNFLSTVTVKDKQGHKKRKR